MEIQATSDEVLLFRQMQQGDVKALNSFFERYADQLYSYAMGFIHHQGEAEDIVQEVFISFWKNRQTLTISTSAFGYLMRAAKNLCIDYRLHLEVEKKYRHEMQSTQESEETADIPEEIYRKVQQAIQRLPEKCREIFIMGCIDELSYKEIADQLGISVNTVKTQIKTAYRKIKSELDPPYLPATLLLVDVLFKNFSH